jgi:2TM domain
METNNQESEKYKVAQSKVKEIQGFYIHSIIYVAINLLIIISNYSYTKSFFYSVFGWSTLGTGLFWGIGLASHWSRVYGKSVFFSKNWEEKKIKQLMDKDQKSTWE